MEQAETFLSLQAVCPSCGDLCEPEFVDVDHNELLEWQCDTCKTDFTYCHPGNNYGLAI